MMKRHVFQEMADKFRHRVPFKPFMIEMDEGEPFIVDAPERFTCVFGCGTYNYPDGRRWVDIDNENVLRFVDLPETAGAEVKPASGS